MTDLELAEPLDIDQLIEQSAATRVELERERAVHPLGARCCDAPTSSSRWANAATTTLRCIEATVPSSMPCNQSPDILTTVLSVTYDSSPKSASE
jgi:hypothetical protein